MTKAIMTHEQYIHAVRDIAATRLSDTAARDKLLGLKLTYGSGEKGVRGMTFYNAWNAAEGQIDFVAVNARAQQSTVQIAGTVIHELAHVLTGPGHGHDTAWRDACKLLGLRYARTGTRYTWAVFSPDVRAAILALGEPSDGKPTFRAESSAVARIILCSHGIGSRGGKSRGEGSGSRMFKCVCPDCGYTARVSRSWLTRGTPICPTDTRAMVRA